MFYSSPSLLFMCVSEDEVSFLYAADSYILLLIFSLFIHSMSFSWKTWSTNTYGENHTTTILQIIFQSSHSFFSLFYTLLHHFLCLFILAIYFIVNCSTTEIYPHQLLYFDFLIIFRFVCHSFLISGHQWDCHSRLFFFLKKAMFFWAIVSLCNLTSL